ncbi:carbon-nitrogen hydrolase family protein [Fulvivirga sp. 29W222]|uniref:Carbon-nitrogen hydrolase family protein n=1 Tax=Fulvivirga marina TaxID=2494733 RepID=A0A937FYM9_9BACT|nr:carbon-nitrogen hydrolase family protein [Fulvivirga marina]MBL6447403.1 carbon-nitrogen hydrolase family protein [Fulvivirga marina]
MSLHKVGIAQYSAHYLNLEKSLVRLEQIVEQAASENMELLVFGETWLSGYPVWLDHCPEVAQWDSAATKAAYLKLRQSSIEIPGRETRRIGALAQKYGMSIVIGVNEVVKKGRGSGTVYNALLTFNNQGKLANHHRKLVPTYTERMIYGLGDGHGLQVAETSVGNVGALVCWEHWMPLTRQSLHDEAEDIHVAVWPTVHEEHLIASRQYAFEGRCFVLAAGQMMRASEFPQELSLPEELINDPDKLVLCGGSCIIDPRGEFVVDPMYEEEGLVTAEIDLSERVKEQMTLDVSGHYQRADIFDFQVDKQRKA